MSHPATEAGNVSETNSVFSDSQNFDAAEKPNNQAAEDAPIVDNAAAEEEAAVAAAAEAEAAAAQEQQAEYPTSDAIITEPSSALTKPRHTAFTQAKRWEAIEFTAPEGDAEDEFDIGTAQKPVYREEEEEKPKVIFMNGEPDMSGEITNCFDEDGLLYRIVDKKAKTWAFYNDSLAFEVHVVCTFGKHSKIEAVENTTMTRGDAGEYICDVVVYPGETEFFIKGYVNGFSSKLRALPLSDDYYQTRSKAQWDDVIERQMQAVRDLAGDETDQEVILQRCIETNTPFVDLSFPPVQSSIDTGASKPFKQLPWARPTQYLKAELQDQVRLFRKAISPGDVDPGELGDCWLLCAVAAYAESPAAIMAMFRHPKGAEDGRLERAVGAYRVTFNKNGLWHSVLVDDYLPVVAGTPKFARSSDPCEIWPSILQKAFAKLHKSYANIQSGDPVHAITDMSGCPSMRFDEDFAEAIETGNSKDLFDKLVGYSAEGFQILMTTAGKAPAITPGTRNKPDFSEEPGLEESLRGTGLLPGHAYTIASVKAVEVDGSRVRLVKIRNAWPYGEAWTGAWSNTSDLWEQHGNVAAELEFDSSDASMQWMPWEEVLKYFVGGGVIFTSDAMKYDVRVPLTFADCRPSALLEVRVSAPTRVCISLSNMDHRAMYTDSSAAAAAEYPPIMLSVAAPCDGPDDDIFRVVKNTSTDASAPSESRWTFLQAREIGMMVDLEPSAGPYLIIPRLMEGGDTLNEGSGEQFEQLVGPTHFVNRGERTYPSEDHSEKKVIPVTVGLVSDAPLADGAQITLKYLSGVNAVFENFPKFPTDDLFNVSNELYFQTKETNCGYAVEKTGTNVY